MESAREQFLFRVIQGGEKENLNDRLIRITMEYHRQGKPLNVSELQSAMNISSRKQIQTLVDRLEGRGKIKTRIDRSSRGAPRVYSRRKRSWRV